MVVSFERDLRRMGMCAFCAHHTHDFPIDLKHERLHMDGWHTCGIDGKFRHNKWNCRNYELSSNVVVSV